jgi:hypothetical protein
MSELFSGDDVEKLGRHLQAIVGVELFTIPLYLTAASSFGATAMDESHPFWLIQQEAVSIAVQEMYHLQLACNLANAWQVTPEVPKFSVEAGKEIPIPHLMREGKPLTTTLANMPDAVESLIGLESPDPDPNFPEPNNDVTYASIADLYHATLQLLGRYVMALQANELAIDPKFKPGNLQVAFATFTTTYPTVNRIDHADDAILAANAITDQGEGRLVRTNSNAAAQLGALLGPDFQLGEEDVQPRFQPAAGSRFANPEWGAYTHHKKLEDIQGKIRNLPERYFYAVGSASTDLPAWAANIGVAKVQEAIDTVWSYILDAMQIGFAKGDLSGVDEPAKPLGFFDAMLSFKYLLPIAWQFGTCPSFTYRSGATPEQVQELLDTVDPLCLYHWDSATATVRASAGFVANACGGLNECRGTGWGGIATTAGDGACATADFHSCGGNNSCRSQGGCGFLSTTTGDALLAPSAQWIPSMNACGPSPAHPETAPTGGCQTPIAPGQVFASSSEKAIAGATGPEWTDEEKARLRALEGTSVWDHARQLLADKLKIPKDQLPTPRSQTGDVNYDSEERRKAIQPSSTK